MTSEERNEAADQLYRDAMERDHESYTERLRQIRLSKESYSAGEHADRLAEEATFLRRQSYKVRSGEADG